MTKKKCALLDTDFISKLHITRKDDENRLIDRVLELPDYQFVCHEQIAIELGRHNAAANRWLQRKITEGAIQKFSDGDLVALQRRVYGKNAIAFYLYDLENACRPFGETYYKQYYAKLEALRESSDEYFLEELARCDAAVGRENNLGEIKTYLLQQVLQSWQDIPLYLFCSDDKKARSSLVNAGGIPCISAISSFYVLKERLGIERSEAKLYFDSWMMFHWGMGQTDFKVHRNTKEMQLIKMDGYEIFNRIYDGAVTILKNGNLKLRSCDY
ncbi:hypothetical protein [Enterocloster lavalensis]|uniref:Uncharacterized protein n=1 Tax=Enterocloster lavalensis TaxID=460384 RepID=A0A1I0GNX3_9FIRM|nr:hypothetical protein [Enterocloster lavalensis]MCB6343155.1 hypothetical protein [Enterocloster lavalensis]SET71950.1 hypothetical protein SAMN05216313_11273 [Enterocloster lavalensis]